MEQGGQVGGGAGRDGPTNTLAAVALGLAAAAVAGLVLLPSPAPVLFAPLGAVAVALGAVAIAEAGRRGRLVPAIVATILGAATVVGGGVWSLSLFGALAGLNPGGVTEERAEVLAQPDLAPVPVPREVPADPSPDAAHPGLPDRFELEDGTGQATVSLNGRSIELELESCATSGLMGGRRLRGEGPDGRIAIHGPPPRLLVVVEADGDTTTLRGRRRGASRTMASGDDAGVRLEIVGELRDVLTGEVVAVELDAECR